MEVGDLVTLSAKGKNLQWIQGLLGSVFWGAREGVWPHYGVITMKHSEYAYHIHWFYDSGKQHVSPCGFERTHLKRFK
jgi:hypothetical protein